MCGSNLQLRRFATMRSRLPGILGFIITTSPAVIISVRRTGFGLTHLLDPGIFVHTPTLLCVAGATLVLCLTSLRYRSWKAFTVGVGTGLGFMACALFQNDPMDYKLWTYLVAPGAVQSTLLASVFVGSLTLKDICKAGF